MIIIALTPHPLQAVPLPLKGEGFVPHPTANAAPFPCEGKAIRLYILFLIDYVAVFEGIAVILQNCRSAVVKLINLLASV